MRHGGGASIKATVWWVDAAADVLGSSVGTRSAGENAPRKHCAEPLIFLQGKERP